MTFRSIAALATIAVTILLAVTHGLVVDSSEQKLFSTHQNNKTTHARRFQESASSASTPSLDLDALNSLNSATASLLTKEQPAAASIDMKSSGVAAFIAMVLLTIFTVATPQAAHKRMACFSAAQPVQPTQPAENPGQSTLDASAEAHNAPELVWNKASWLKARRNAPVKTQLQDLSPTEESINFDLLAEMRPVKLRSSKKVQFGQVEVRSFARVAGGGGGIASHGPPLGMGWDITSEEGFTVCEYETIRDGIRLEKHDFAYHGRVSSQTRHIMLRAAGETDETVQSARATCKAVRQERAENNEELGLAY